MSGKPRVVARRGDVERGPENTLPAFESAIERGADGVELDVHPTADGEVVVHHYYSLGSTDDGEGLVCEHTLAELQALDAGGWFDLRFAGVRKPTLRQVLARCGGRTAFEIDVKGSSLAFLQQVVGEIERLGLAGDVELTTEHAPLLAHARRLWPGLRTGAFFYEPPSFLPLRLAQEHVFDWATLLEIDVVHLDAALVTAAFVDRLHVQGLVAYGSNLDTEEEMRRCLGLGIDAFSTGRLGLALRVRDEFATD